MKFPSIKTLADNAFAVILRFPIEITFAFIGTIAASVNIQLQDINNNAANWCWRIIMMANLGLLLNLATSLFCHSRSLKPLTKVLLKITATLIPFLLLFAINPDKRSEDIARFFLISISFHLLVSFSAFLGSRSINDFWQFNKTLFLRFLSGILYSAVLYLGLSAAIAALNFLFGFKFEWDTFVTLWVWIVGVFNTLFVLAGIPENVNSPKTDETYPKGLKIFTQYVLIPLVTVYLVILLAYEIKIGLIWSLPKGRVSSLILAYAVLGILSLLLVYPIRNQDENKWIKSFSKSFYFLMLPLLGLLFLAVGARVFKYGITEERYFLIVLALWLLFVSLYFLTSKKQNIKVIPISLCLVTLFAVYGPQSAFYVSYVSQKNIIKNIFGRNKAFKNGVLLPVNERVFNREDAAQAISAFNYIISRKGLEALQVYFKQNLKQVTDSLETASPTTRHISGKITKYELTAQQLDWVKVKLNLTRFNNYGTYLGAGYQDPGITGNNYYLSSSYDDMIKVTGYDYVIDINSNASDTLKYMIGKNKVKVFTARRNNCFLEINSIATAFDIQNKLDSLNKLSLKDYADHNNPTGFTLPGSLLQIDKTLGKYKIRLMLKHINAVKETGTNKNKIIYLSGAYLIKEAY